MVRNIYSEILKVSNCMQYLLTVYSDINSVMANVHVL